MMKKAVLGSRVRRLRQQRGLTQQEMAQRLGISPSYLNLIEHDQRPVTIALLLKLGRTFDVDLEDFSAEDDKRLALALREIFADAALSAHGVDAADIEAVVHASPRAAKAVLELFRAYRSARDDASALTLGLSGGAGAPSARRYVLPTEEVRDFFYDRTNHFPALEAAAEGIRQAARADDRPLDAALLAHLAARGLSVEFADPSTMGDALRRFDPERRRLVMASGMAATTRLFQLAFQVALIDARETLDAEIAAARFASHDSERLARVGLANYLAAAILMPYEPFFAAARRLRYDIEALAPRFGASFEQTCHRLTTMQRPGAKGVGFYLMRVDVAGNVSKRFSGAGFHFSRFGGSCPRWIVHQAFATPGQIRTQVARLPDGATFFAIARTLDRPRSSFAEIQSHLALGIGCDIGDAAELVYANSWNLAAPEVVTEIGIGCRLCERMDCRQRAFPPLHHRLLVDDREKPRSAYRFAPNPLG